MKKKVIKLNEYKSSNEYSMKRLVNSGCWSSEYLNKSETVSNARTEIGVSYDALVNFVIDFGVRVLEDDTEEYIRFMLEYHNCITFYGIKYYLPFYKFEDEKYKLFNYLIKNHKYP
jgi:hypothetical protein